MKINSLTKVRLVLDLLVLRKYSSLTMRTEAPESFRIDRISGGASRKLSITMTRPALGMLK